MFKKIWNTIKAPFVRMHEKIKKIAPGLKTKLVTGLGAIGSLAAVLQEFISGLPLSQLVGATEALIISAVLFTLAFWFRSMSR